MYSNDEKLRKVQILEKNLLNYVDQICNHYQLKYFICGGTLIGAVREKGFISWDDDADIMMPRRDYEWLKNHRKEIFTNNYKLFDYAIDEEATSRCMPEIRDDCMKILYKQGNKEREQYIMLDIFPLDGMPRGKIKVDIHYYHIFLIRMFLQLSWYDKTVNQYKKNRPLWEKIVIATLNIIKVRPRINSRVLLQRMNKVLKKYEFETSSYVCSMYGPFKKKEILPKCYFEERVRLPFEDIELWAPKMYHEELTHYYGDYMTPPSDPNERELHHRITICE